MCGISGFINKNKHKDAIIKRLNGLISHRGPDEEGFYIDNAVAMGHRRLSIIDLTTGRQPMVDGDYVIVFNGEIYNYAKLKKLLLGKGYLFNTASDTEVLLKMYIAYGERCLDYLDGMFAFAIWDKKRKKLFAARDRLGVKPFYYAMAGKDLVWGSEIKVILNYPGWKKKLNKKVLNSYFQYRYIIGEETFFEEIYSLLPGHFLTFDYESKMLKIRKYWELPVAFEKKNKGEDFYIAKTKELVQESIRERMVSDVPIGAYLSGGLDSSIITAVMASLMKSKRLDTFTIGFKETGFNEFKYADIVAKFCGANHHQIMLSAENYLDTIDKLILFKDAPLAVPNEVPLYLMSRELKHYITVVMSGEGADELFCGYGRIFDSYIEFKGALKDYCDFFLQRYNYVSDSDLQKFLSPDILKIIRKNKYTRGIFERYFKKIRYLRIEDKIPYIFENLHLQGLLQRVDNSTMAASVEGRVPFVDSRRLVEFVNNIPFGVKIKWASEASRHDAVRRGLAVSQVSETCDTTKYLLRAAFKDSLPGIILKRRKVGFPVPLDIWFKGKFKSYAKDTLSKGVALRMGIFNADYIKSGQFFAELSGINIWMMISLDFFLRKYFD